MVKRGQGAFEYILLLAGVLLIVVLAIIILRGTIQGDTGTAKALCLAQISKAAPCYNTDGSWNVTSAATDAVGYLGADYGVDATKCLLTPTGALSSTTWRVSNANFRCGPKPA
ncbi:MAG: class III signal peptide-containing protein [Candidatus Micrarchaeota archaeon]